MRSSPSVFVLLIAGTVQAAVPIALPPPKLLQPSGPWTVEYAKNMCVLSRSFGVGKDRTIFAFKPAPNSNSGRLMLIQSGEALRVRSKAEIILSDGSRPPWASFWHASSKGTRLTAIDVPRTSLEPLFAGGSISIRASKDLNLEIAPTGMPKAIEALSKCEADLLKTWGMDEVAQASLAKAPERIGNFFKADDYPTDLVDQGVQGTVGVVMNVDDHGQLTNCRIVETSGTPELDEATCGVLRKRAKFNPAVNRDGAAMAALTYWRVNWQIEDGFTYSTGGLSPPASSSFGISQ